MSEGGGSEYRADDHVWAGRMTGQHGPVLRFMRHDAQRERLLSSEKSGKKGGRLEKLWVPQFFSSDELQSGRLPDALTRTVRVRATVVYLIPVAHGRLAVRTTSAVVRCHKMNILSRR